MTNSQTTDRQPYARYHTICTATREAKKIGMEAMGITGMFNEVTA